MCGLAYSEYGGSVLFIESSQASFNPPKEKEQKMEGELAQGRGTGRIIITGSLGEVMKESSSIAHTFAKNFLNQNDSPASNKYKHYFDTHDIHIHFPEGAVPKVILSLSNKNTCIGWTFCGNCNHNCITESCS